MQSGKQRNCQNFGAGSKADPQTVCPGKLGKFFGAPPLQELRVRRKHHQGISSRGYLHLTGCKRVESRARRRLHWKIHTIFLASRRPLRPKTSRRHTAHLPCAITRTGIPTPALKSGSTPSKRHMSFFPIRKSGLNITTASTTASSSIPRMKRRVCGVLYSVVAESSFRSMTVHLPED